MSSFFIGLLKFYTYEKICTKDNICNSCVYLRIFFEQIRDGNHTHTLLARSLAQLQIDKFFLVCVCVCVKRHRSAERDVKWNKLLGQFVFLFIFYVGKCFTYVLRIYLRRANWELVFFSALTFLCIRVASIHTILSSYRFPPHYKRRPVIWSSFGIAVQFSVGFSFWLTCRRGRRGGGRIGQAYR